MSQIIFVDLTSSTSGTGASASPYTWAQVVTLVSGLASGSSHDLVFKLRGLGTVLGTNLTCSTITASTKLVFESDDPASYGLAVLRFGSSTASSFLNFVSPTNLNVQVRNLVLDVNQPVVGNTYGTPPWSMLQVSNPTTSQALVENCTIISRGESAQYVTVTNTGTGVESKVAVVGNTMLTTSIKSSSYHTLARVQGAQLYTGRNYIGQSAASVSAGANVAVSQCIVSTTTGASAPTHYVGANAFSAFGTGSYRYQGITWRQVETDVMVAVATTGIWHDTAGLEDPTDYVNPGISISRSSVFWPVHGSALLGIGTESVDGSINLGASATDALGLDRTAGSVDAGAFQKTALPDEQTLYVDLSSTGITGALGTIDDPISITDFQLDYARRAPIDYTLTYVLSNDNVGASSSAFDFGPLGPDGVTTYGGSGSVVIDGLKTYVKAPPIWSLSSLKPNAVLPVYVKNVKLEWASGTSTFIAPGSISSSSKFQLRNCVIRSTADTHGRLAALNSGSSTLQLFGCSVALLHSDGYDDVYGLMTSSGATVYLDLCAFDLLGTSMVLGSGGTAYVHATRVTTGGTVATWSGATIDSSSLMGETDTAFVDPTNSSYAAADFTLVAGSSAIAIAASGAVLSTDAQSALVYDLRLLTRNAYPLGSTALDAGAYEYGYYVPTPKHYYLDLSKTRSGTGVLGNRWCPSDFQSWLNSTAFAGTTISGEIVVHTVRSGKMALAMPAADANVNGKLTVVSEQLSSPLIWKAGATVAITVSSAAVSGDATLSVSALTVAIPNDTVLVFGSVTVTTEAAAAIGDTTLTIAVLSDSIVSGTSASYDSSYGQFVISGGSDANVPVTIRSAILSADDAANIASLPGATLTLTNSIVDVKRYIAPKTNIAVTADKLVTAGVSFVETFENELGISTTAFAGTTIEASHSGIQGHAYSSTTKTGVGFSATSGDTRYCGFYSVTTPHTGTTDVGSATSTNQLFAARSSTDLDLTDFTLTNTSFFNFMGASDLPSWEPTNSELDLVGNRRSQALDGGSDTYDVGAIEVNYLASAGTYDNDPGSTILTLTDVGIALDTRSASDGTTVFKLAGYVVGAAGSLYWDPTQPTPSSDEGAPLRATISSNGSSAADSFVTVVTPNATTTVNGPFSGSTALEILSSIASALRAHAAFNSDAWCRVNAATNQLEIRSWTYGDAANDYLNDTKYKLSVDTTYLSRTNFSGAVEPTVTSGRRWPTTGYAEWFGTENPDPRSISFVARMDYAEGNGAIGEIVAIALIVASPLANEVGLVYPYARARMPLHVKHDREVLVRRFMFSH